VDKLLIFGRYLVRLTGIGTVDAETGKRGAQYLVHFVPGVVPMKQISFAYIKELSGQPINFAPERTSHRELLLGSHERREVCDLAGKLFVEGSKRLGAIAVYEQAASHIQEVVASGAVDGP